MKFENLMYDGKEIRVIVDLDDCFVESNDYNYVDDCDTLDLSSMTDDIEEKLEG